MLIQQLVDQQAQQLVDQQAHENKHMKTLRQQKQEEEQNKQYRRKQNMSPMIDCVFRNRWK